MSGKSGARHRSGLRLVPAVERATHAVGVYLQTDARFGCTQAEANVLAFLYARDGSPLSELHASFGHRRSTLTSVIDRLEQRSLVVRERDPQDGRAFNLALTRAGAATARAVTSHLRALEQRAASRVTEGDIEGFLEVARALADAAQR
ncbi:MAG TPA: MarR family winged helix-turn-helix transcriptional regulator [Candidatus Baltobacteraceae bacterium]|nr:MarR family winged helix-turn-helix transcriptional regulator [Candidatus Baltobacteraceae bacterium]